VLAAATRLFHRCGVRAVSVDNIIAVAAVSKMGFYHHFGSKEELVAAILDREARRAISALRRHRSWSATGGLTSLVDGMARALRSPACNGSLFITVVVDHPSPGLRRQCAEFQERLLVEIARLLPTPAPPDLPLQVLMILEGMIISHLADPDGRSAAAARAALQTLLDGHQGSSRRPTTPDWSAEYGRAHPAQPLVPGPTP